MSEGWGGRKAAQYTAKTLERYGNTCHLCGLTGADTADHLIPRSVDASLTYDLDNLRPAHRSCNSSRGARVIEGPAAIVEDGTDFFRSG